MPNKTEYKVERTFSSNGPTLLEKIMEYLFEQEDINIDESRIEPPLELNEIYNAGIYCCLSKDDNKGTESNSITSQKESLTDYVKRQGWFLHKVYMDDGYSGVSFDRPAFKDMISDIEKG